MASDRNPIRILLFGPNGQVGYELEKSLKPLGRLTSVSRAEADFSNPEGLRSVVRKCSPDILVNAAAYTAVDKAEAEPGLALAINAQSPGVLAEEAQAIGACMVHYSTDYVFDGKSERPYAEDSPANPLSVYGRSKLAGDLAVIKSCHRHLIFRASWVWGIHGNNFPKTILRLADERSSLRIVDDQQGTPTFAGLIAGATANVLAVMQAMPATDTRWGVYHLCSEGATSWHGFARYIVETALANGAKFRVSLDDIFAIPSSDYPQPAPRPANSTLDTRKITATFDLHFDGWKSDVNKGLNSLVS